MKLHLKKFDLYIYLILILTIFNSYFSYYVVEDLSALPKVDYTIESDGFRAMDFGEDNIQAIFDAANKYDISPYELITSLMVINKYSLEGINISSYSRSDFIKIRNKIVRRYPQEYKKLCDSYQKVFSGLTYFPVAASSQPKRKWVSFVNSWGYSRTYGGERTHEGCDIMAGDNTRGIYPLLSVCDGTITNVGWLELGGYRLGITSNDGGYFYYAHMAAYAPDMKEGMTVKSGQFLGYMGDTGYSVVEGTTGNFDVHLHFGIYLTDAQTEISLNPYYILKYLENKRLCYTY